MIISRMGLSPIGIKGLGNTVVYGLNLVGLRRQGVDSKTIKQLSHAFKILFNSGLSINSALQKLNQTKYTSAEISHLTDFIKNSKRGVCRHC